MATCPKCGATLPTTATTHQLRTDTHPTTTNKTITKYYCTACHTTVYTTIA